MRRINGVYLVLSHAPQHWQPRVRLVGLDFKKQVLGLFELFLFVSVFKLSLVDLISTQLRNLLIEPIYLHCKSRLESMAVNFELFKCMSLLVEFLDLLLFDEHFLLQMLDSVFRLLCFGVFQFKYLLQL